MSDVTVLLTVFNGEDYLRECIRSILAQTFQDFILLIIDDASTDATPDIIRSFKDSRIQTVTLNKNVGHVVALNRGLELIETPLIARMDADDICFSPRLARQVQFMSRHPEVGICGTFATAFENKKEINWRFPCEPADIKVKLMFECSLVHSSVMMRRDFLLRYQLRYNETFKHSYDWELWQRCSQYFDLANIPEYLVKYRIHEKSESVQTLGLQNETAQRLDDSVLNSLGLDQHPLRHIHRAVATETFSAKNREEPFFYQTVEWFNELRKANHHTGVFDNRALNRFLKGRLFMVINNNVHHGKPVFGIFWREKLFLFVPMIWSFKFLVKLILTYMIGWGGGIRH